MNQGQGTVLRSSRVIDSSSEIESPADPDMAQANSNDFDTNDNSDISSQLSEIKESYERRISELHQEFSQLKDLMMAIVSKNNNESQPSSSKGPSKPAQQHGFDTGRSYSGPYMIPGRSYSGPYMIPGRSYSGPYMIPGRSWQDHSKEICMIFMVP